MNLRDITSPANGEYVEELYRRYLGDRASVGAEWARVFAELSADGGAGSAAVPMPRGSEDVSLVHPVLGVFDLVHSYREIGHLIAQLDPLGHNQERHPLLEISEFGFTESDLDRVVQCGNFKGCATASLHELIAALKETYCDTLGVEYTDIPEKQQRDWLQDRMEPSFNKPRLSREERVNILSKLIAAEGFEQFLQAKHPTQKRFSLEGAETLIPLLDALLEEAGSLGVQEIVMGMAHRGRLNVLANVLRKPYEMILSEFGGTLLPTDVMGDGDVKYHLGYSRDHTTRGGHRIHLSLSPNPSHLEMINPVIEGMVRAKQQYQGDAERRRVVPLLIHGDAAFSGEGIVPETLALSELEAYRTGGTLHVILNNQIGFTTSPAQYRFTPYASDIAKVIRAPVFHVNGDAPEAAVHAARLAIGFRQAFKKDVIIDAEECFCLEGCCPNRSTRASGPGSAHSTSGHGPHVTGIIASNGSVSGVGVAPETHVVAIRVLNDQARGAVFDWISALDWLLVNRTDVHVINMSVVSDLLYAGGCDAANGLTMAFADVIGQLRARGVLVVAASGNNGLVGQLPAPACIATAVAVGAVDRQDRITSYSNRAASLSLLAPAEEIESDMPNGTTGRLSGTSMAAPHVTGAVALLRPLLRARFAASLGDVLIATGTQVIDPRTCGGPRCSSFPRVDLEAALQWIEGIPARFLPGGGSRAVDCQLEWQVRGRQPGPPSERPRISCTDGDPTCDADSVAGRCTFTVSACFNVPDSRLDACDPTRELSAYRLRQPSPFVQRDQTDLLNMVSILAAMPPLPIARSAQCTPPFTFVVPRGDRGATRSLRLSAESARGTDADRLRFTCMPP